MKKQNIQLRNQDAYNEHYWKSGWHEHEHTPAYNILWSRVGRNDKIRGVNINDWWSMNRGQTFFCGHHDDWTKTGWSY